MKKWLTLGLAFGLGLAFADTASAQIKLGVAGPITGGSAAFGAQLKNGVEQAVEDINAAGGILGQKITTDRRRRSRRSEGRRLGRQQVRRRRREIRRRPLQFRRHHPGLRGLSGERHPDDHARRHQSARHRAQHVEHLPHLRPGRPAGRGRGRLHSQELQGQEDRHRPRQDHLRPGSRRRDQGDDQQGRPEGSALRGRQQGRQGLLRAGVQGEGIRRRPHLLGRPARHRRPDPAADARRRACGRR